MEMSKCRPRLQQPRLLFVDQSQAEFWSRLTPEQQQFCRKLISQLLQQIVSHQDNAGGLDERSDGDE
jgi:hypothetical protein